VLRLPDAYFDSFLADLRHKRDLPGDGLRAAGSGVYRPQGTYCIVPSTWWHRAVLLPGATTLLSPAAGTAARSGDSGVYAARAAGGVMMVSYSTGVKRARRL
jgi:hypothetical protein